MRAPPAILAHTRLHLLVIIVLVLITVPTLGRVAGIAALSEVLCAREARDDVAGGAGDDVSFEELGDGLERDAFCLRYAEDGVDYHYYAGAAEDEEGAVGDSVEHDGGELVGGVSLCFFTFDGWVFGSGGVHLPSL